MQDPVVDKIVPPVARVGEHGVPEAVGIAACLTPWRGEILDMFAGIGGVQQATVFGSERRPLLYAAMLNAYQIHGQEFDWCTSEQSPRQGAALWNAVFAVETVDDVRALAGLSASRGG